MPAGGLSEATLAGLATVFRRHSGIERVVLFGSRAKGGHRAGSDIDLALSGASLTLDDLLAIDREIDDLLLPYKVDLVLVHRIDRPELLAHIGRVGIELYRPGR